MPVVKRKPHVEELLNIAVKQRKDLDETKAEILSRPVSIWISSLGDTPRERIERHAIIISHASENVARWRVVQVIRACIWPLALAIMIYFAPKAGLDDFSIETDSDKVFYALDIILSIIFLFDSILRFLGTLIRVKVEVAFNRELNNLNVFLEAGLIDVNVTCFFFGFGLTYEGMWIRLLRLVLITSAVVDSFPHVAVLLSGVSNGLKSVFFTILLLFLLIMTYAVLGHALFARNDPFHFGTYALSALTFFQLSTFDNWASICDVNRLGCREFNGEYLVDDDVPSVRIDTSFGVFYSPACNNHQAQPIAAPLVFCSYTILAGYVIVSMCLSAVALGINERLESLRNIDVYNFGDEEDRHSSMRQAEEKKKKKNIHNSSYQSLPEETTQA